MEAWWVNRAAFLSLEAKATRIRKLTGCSPLIQTHDSFKVQNRQEESETHIDILQPVSSWNQQGTQTCTEETDVKSCLSSRCLPATFRSNWRNLKTNRRYPCEEIIPAEATRAEVNIVDIQEGRRILMQRENNAVIIGQCLSIIESANKRH